MQIVKPHVTTILQTVGEYWTFLTNHISIETYAEISDRKIRDMLLKLFFMKSAHGSVIIHRKRRNFLWDVITHPYPNSNKV